MRPPRALKRAFLGVQNWTWAFSISLAGANFKKKTQYTRHAGEKNINVDYVILSNVLEHIENRIQFLKDIQKATKSNRFLIRVPNFSRDWQIPMRKELGIYYFSDNDHKIEHTSEELEQELKSAGFIIKEKITIWGEIWTECEYEL